MISVSRHGRDPCYRKTEARRITSIGQRLELRGGVLSSIDDISERKPEQRLAARLSRLNSKVRQALLAIKS